MTAIDDSRLEIGISLLDARLELANGIERQLRDEVVRLNREVLELRCERRMLKEQLENCRKILL